MSQSKYLFIDRDGTLIKEPEDYQVDSIDKVDFMPGVFVALNRLKKANFKFVMVSNQDGLGTASFPEETFHPAHNLVIKTFQSQGIEFEKVLVCPHFEKDNCDCRKPKVGLVLDYLKDQSIDRQHSYVIGDRETDVGLAENMGIGAIQITSDGYESWQQVADYILSKPRKASVSRVTKETEIDLAINLDDGAKLAVNTGLHFLDHMIDQIGKHSGMSLELQVKGDLEVDDHHTIEDIGIVLGSTIKQALGDKLNIGRYGFTAPLDESLAQVAIDLSNRPCCVFKCDFEREKVGDLATEMIEHFFVSFADGLRAAVHIQVEGDNEHHKVEAIFKSVGRALGQAIAQTGEGLPSTKGAL